MAESGGENLETATQDIPETVEVEAQPERAVPAEEFTVEELTKVVDAVIQRRLNAHWRGLEGRFQPLEEQAKETRQSLGVLETLRQQSDRLVAATLAPEELDAMKREADDKALQERLAKAERGEQAWQDIATKTIQQQDQEEWQTVQGRLEAYAKSQGLASSAHLPVPSERVPTPTDIRGWHGWEEAAKEVIDAEVERLAKAARPQARITTERPAGDTGDRIQSLVNRAGKGEDLTPTEMAQVAKALDEGYTVKRSR